MNAIGDKGTSMITGELQSYRILENLNVSNCELSVKGTVAIQNVLICLMDDWYDSPEYTNITET